MWWLRSWAGAEEDPVLNLTCVMNSMCLSLTVSQALICKIRVIWMKKNDLGDIPSHTVSGVLPFCMAGWLAGWPFISRSHHNYLSVLIKLLKHANPQLAVGELRFSVHPHAHHLSCWTAGGLDFILYGLSPPCNVQQRNNFPIYFLTLAFASSWPCPPLVFLWYRAAGTNGNHFKN